MPTLKRIQIKNKGEDALKKDAATTPPRESEDAKFSQSQSENITQNSTAALHESLSIKSAINNRIRQSVSDITAVVLSIQHSSGVNIASKTFTANHNKTRVRILISDNSLPVGQCARVNLYTSRDSQHLNGLLGVTREINDRVLQPGDVVRLNRLEVRNCVFVESGGSDCSASPVAKKARLQFDERENKSDKADDSGIENENSLLKVVCDLYPSWKEPTPGPIIARICRINPAKKSNNIDSEDTDFNLDWETEITACMKTPRKLVQELAQWYCSTKQQQHFVPTNQPCQRRKLRDINMPNVSSHVVVKVLRCEKTSSQSWNRGKQPKPECITHATLSDGPESEDIMGLGGSIQKKQVGKDICFIPKSISDVLLQSLAEGCFVLLTHVMSKNIARESSLGGREALVLIPTQETIATVITPDHPFYVKTSPCKSENAFASQPFTLERASQLYSMSQQHSPNFSISTDAQRPNCRGMMAVVSPLQDINIDGIYASFREGRYWQTNQSLSKFLIDTPTISTPFSSIQLPPIYRSGTISLDPAVFCREMVIHADGDALKLLCMEVPAEDMVIDRFSNEGQHPYLDHVGELLRGLCEEKTLVRWVLEQESERSWFVRSASLIEI